MSEAALQRDEIIIPGRDAISEACFLDEDPLLEDLLAGARASDAEKRAIEPVARKLVAAAREGRRRFGGIDAFMHEYGLTSDEGIVLMCLAEALLRIPDSDTADKLIADKIGSGDWGQHLGQSESLFVNASSWGLMLTGRVIDLNDGKRNSLSGQLGSLVARLGEPIIREAMRHAMRILGQQFVLGRDIGEALSNAADDEADGYSFSYDMLGEAACTARDAGAYYDRYRSALDAVAENAGPAVARTDKTLFARPGLSVKLSALHPRFEAAKEERLITELVPRLRELALSARHHWLSVTVDAEEADRLDLTLEIFGRVLADEALNGWNGLGLAVQAYSMRALRVLDWLAELSRATGHRIPVRLVKGAYWDAEIKAAQVGGLKAYPVFTRKANSDVSYLAGVRKLLAEPECFYPQFATHNAHTIASVVAYAGERSDYEFQRLHGMGRALYEPVLAEGDLNRPVRIYAPVGGHEDLLAYLVRRLLENGSNTSFVNRIADDEEPIEEIIADPAERVSRRSVKSHPEIPLPRDLFSPDRLNSAGLPLWHAPARLSLMASMRAGLDQPLAVGPIVSGDEANSNQGAPVTSPHDATVEVGICRESGGDDINRAFDAAARAQKQWDDRGGGERATLLEAAADRLEAHHAALMAVMVREAGKTLENAHDEVREAADFLRYYAMLARRDFAGLRELPGPTGELNQISLHGRGVFACISPWNFPLAIFTGQIAAALAAGNAVLAKPAEQTPLTAALAVRLFHEAGLPADVLHLLPGRGESVGTRLVRDPRLGGVAFTGSVEVAAVINRSLAERSGPILPLIAETGGLNAMIVDSTALPEQVIRDVLRSAFDSAGQRCSALRVLCLQDDVAEPMITMLKGAMEELSIGDPMDYATDIGPVIDADAARVLENHKARMRAEQTELIDLPLPAGCRNGTFVSPAAYEISAFDVLKEEVFGPILHVLRYRSDELDQLCDAINASGYGLTLGIHSRIGATVETVAGRVRAGNIYINRNQVGAVVGVQPFGGEGLSGTGPKAGGPHTLIRFAVERVRSNDITAAGGNAALLSL